MVNKRSLEDSVQISRKKQKAGRHASEVVVNAQPEINSVLLDQLLWKKVSLPDRFEDAEGFFGLEEIDDVDVVRDTANRKVQYRVFSKAINGKDASAQSLTNLNNADDSGIGGGNGSGQEWEGFDSSISAKEERPENVVYQSRNSKGKKESKSENKKLQKKKKKKKKKVEVSSISKQVEPSQTGDGNGFDVLPDTENEITDVSSWQHLQLSPEVLMSLAKLRFSRPTPIQNATIPEILNGHDCIGKASTGSGKTLAFGIPILEHFLSTGRGQSKTVVEGNGSSDPPIAMILLPTRELAHQLATHLKDLCSNTIGISPRIVTLTGGLSSQKQQRLLVQADIVIGTPGRLWETMSESQEVLRSLKKIKFLVVDEADRLLSEGHFKEVEEILNSLDRDDDNSEDNSDQEHSKEIPPQEDRQTLVFSATFQKELQQKLAGKSRFSGGELMGKQESMECLLKKLNFREEKPKFIDVNPLSQMATGLREGLIECGGLEKDLYLYALLLHYPNTRSLIFTNSISSVRRLVPFLQNLNVVVHALHSQMPQKARLRSIERFSSPSHPGSILIATDVAARGLDIPSVQLIIHYHLPRAADMYVHRSGRTARAEKSGSSILLCAPEEVVGVRRLIAKVHARNSDLPDSIARSFIRTLDLNRQVVARLKPRVTLAKKISDASLAKEKKGHEDNWLRTAADDLGVQYDTDEFAAQEGSKKGRGAGRKKAEREARSLSKAELAGLRAELKELLSKRVNVGVSERYLTAGGLDVDELLRMGAGGEFLGKLDGVGFD